MLMIRNRSRSLLSFTLISVAILCFAGGIYLLWTALSPEIATRLIDPENNQTTRLLAETKDETPPEPHLYIPKIDVNVPYTTGTEAVMERGAWWRKPNNGNPKDGGNFVLSAHRFIMGVTPEQTRRQSPFYSINKLALGDEIIVDYHGHRYTYEITKIYSVTPDAIEIEAPTEDARLTLYSCTLGGASDGREVIIARLKGSASL